jgi:hypothetical protein
MRHTLSGPRVSLDSGHSLRQDSKFMAKTGILGGSSPKWSPIALKTFRKLLVSSMGHSPK